MIKILEFIDAFMGFVNTHGVLCVTVATAAQYFFGALIDSLPEPIPMGNQWYAFCFRFAHKLAANWSRGRRDKIRDRQR